MASSNPSAFAADDQTDADFFDKLVDDDDDNLITGAAASGGGGGSSDGGDAMARELFSLSLGDVATSLDDSGAKPTTTTEAVTIAATAPPSKFTAPSEAAAATVQPDGGSSGSGKSGTAGSSKGTHTTIKQVQWSVFGGGGGGDPFSDFLTQDGASEKPGWGIGSADKEFFGIGSGGGGSNDPFSTQDARVDKPDLGGGVTDQGFSRQGGSSGSGDPFSRFSMQEGPLDKPEFGGGVPTDQEFFGGPAVVQSSFAGSLDLHQDANVQLEQSSSSMVAEQAAVDTTDPKYLESLYPGWKYDNSTQQWFQVDNFSPAVSTQLDNSTTNVAAENSNSLGTMHQENAQFNISYLQNSAQAVLEPIAEESTMGSVSNWNQDSSTQGATEYPPNMLFYAEYPGWYYDTNTQQWNTLESYLQATTQTAPSTVQDEAHDLNAPADGFAGINYNVGKTENHTVHNQGTQEFAGSRNSFSNNYTQEFAGSQNSFSNNYTQQGQWQPDAFGSQIHSESFSDNCLAGSFYDSSMEHAGSHMNQQTSIDPFKSSANHQTVFNAYGTSPNHQASYKGFEPSTSYHHAGSQGFEHFTSYNQSGTQGFEPSTSHSYGSMNGVTRSQSFVPMESKYQSQMVADLSPQVNLSDSYMGGQNSMNFLQQQFPSANASHTQFGYTPHEERSSAGRPPHALVTFGFGGKLIVMKEDSSFSTNFSNTNQGNSGGTVSVLNLSEIVADKIDASSIINGNALSYFHALCRQPIPGPLVGGNATTKDVNKWLDEMVACYESFTTEFQKGDLRKLLMSLLKISCQHYGKLRSPFGSDPSQEELDSPEMAVTKLFSSAKRSSFQMREYASIGHCMKNLPSEGQMQASAIEVQNFLVSGKRREALQCAQEGQLWGPALILALQLGDKFYVDTVKKMAHCHFVSGSPLRTLCLLIAGQPADVFNVENSVDGSYGALGASQQPVESTPGGMLDDWEENLAIITANRTKGDELVMTHLGDCLWKEKKEVIAAHSCYLVAEVNIESYSESARLCLIGSDHLKCPRTFASPEAIQRTEVYEYAKVLGNSQYILLPFQPYKLIYACMLAEVGRISDSLRYCQASLKVLKSSGRAPELETWKQLFSSLEERIRTHQQGGYGTNLAPAKLVGKLFTSLDKSISRMMGTPSAPLPPLPQGSVNETNSYPAAAKVVNSQSVMAMSSLMPSASVESISAMAGSGSGARKIGHNRSVSEPDFGRTPKQAAGSNSTQGSASGSGGSRFGWFSSTLQKTMGFVSKSHRQAKLGESNKFYYDEKLKRWVEEGAEPAAEEPPLPPPPPATSFQNGMPDYNLNGPKSDIHIPNGFPESKSSNPSEHSSGMPPIPPSQNQFSARGRMGVRSRYVDTFNKGGQGGAAPSFFNSPATPSVKPPVNAKFFVPTAPVGGVSDEQKTDQASESNHETTLQDEPSSSAPTEVSFSSPPPQPAHLSSPISTMQRFSSMDNITPYRGSATSSGSDNGSFSRSRAASWSGTYTDSFSGQMAETKPGHGGQNIPSPFMPGNPSHSRSNSSSSAQLNGLADDLHEVEL